MKTSVLEFIFKNTVEDREQKKISAIEGGNSEWILGLNINDPEQKQKINKSTRPTPAEHKVDSFPLYYIRGLRGSVL